MKTRAIKTLLQITCSPRGDESTSTQLSNYLVDQLLTQFDGWAVDTLDLWQETPPPVRGPSVSAKYKKLGGLDLDPEETKEWQNIKAAVDRFKQADAIALSTPIWNFGVPYVLKHYIDYLTQPHLCFSWTPEEGYKSLIPPKPAAIICSGASDYEHSKSQDYDFCTHYLQRWLKVYMGCDVQTVTCTPTAADPAAVEQAKCRAQENIFQFTQSL